MYHICPKCGFENQEGKDNNVCPQCGLIFEKWLKNQFKSQATLQNQEHLNNTSQNVGFFLQNIKEQLLYIPDKISKERFYLNSAIYILFFVWGWSFILADHYSGELNESFMHSINLVFHEAGHVIFRLFGYFMTVLGGSLMQLIMPLIIIFSLLIKNKDTFGASIGLWWLAQSLMDLVAYINDAQRQEMWLLGGVQGKDMPGIHDWNNIFNELGLLDHTHAIAVTVSWFAILLMLLAFVWGAVLLGKYSHSSSNL